MQIMDGLRVLFYWYLLTENYLLSQSANTDVVMAPIDRSTKRLLYLILLLFLFPSIFLILFLYYLP